nr:hypothetical protein [Tanacetum cinerariifolium]
MTILVLMGYGDYVIGDNVIFKEAIHLILIGIGDEIYSTVDACKTAHEMWEAIERIQLVATMQVNVQFLYQLHPEWSRNKNVDTTLRYKNDNQTGQFRNQRIMNVAGARETVGSQVVQQTGIQCFNYKEFGHFAKECRKLKRVKDSTYHKKKMLLCKQAEKGVQLQAEQSDWLADTDKEIDEQELKAHYNYMAKIQEHSEQPKFISNTCVVETGDSNVIPDSPDMCDNDIQNDQTAVECDDERVALAILIANLKLDVDENKKIQKQLKKANKTLAHELTECKSILVETSRSLEESNSIRDSCLVAIQAKQTDFEKYKTLNDRTTQNDSFVFVHELKQEMHANLKYVESLEKEIDKLESDKAEFSNMYDMLLQECTVRFGNDQFALIIGYGDLVQGNIMINMVYYVKDTTVPSQQELDLLFGPLYNEFFNAVQIRRQLATDLEMCMFALTVSTTELKNIKEAMANSAWIEAMQEELHQFDRLQVCCSLGSCSDFCYLCCTQVFYNLSDGRKTSFLNGPLKVEVHVAQPDRFIEPDHPEKVYRLRKALYGLKQAPKAWYDELSNFLISKGFTKGLQIHQSPRDIIINQAKYALETLKKYGMEKDKALAKYALETLKKYGMEKGQSIAFSDADHTRCIDTRKSTSGGIQFLDGFVDLDHPEKVYQLMIALYGLKQAPKAWYDELSKFLTSKGFTKGLQIHQSPHSIFINQAKYALEILHKHGMEKGKRIGTPMATKPKLDADLSGNPVDQINYRSKIKSLVYLTSSRPDIVQAGSSFGLTAFSDADHAGCIDSRKITSEGIQFLGDKLVSWMLKKQNCTAMSSTEAEYVALSASCAQVMWMRTQLQDYDFTYNKIPLYCDFQSTIAISYNPVQHSRTKHIHTRYHFMKEQVGNGIIELYFVRTDYQLADMFTKALPEDRFKYLVRRIGIRCLTLAELEVLANESACDIGRTCSYLPRFDNSSE